MTNQNNNTQCDIGLIGLGVMGRNFAQNMADRGYAVAGYDRDGDKTQALISEKNDRQDLQAARDVGTFLKMLKKPRAVMMLVPAGDPVDAVIADLVPHLDAADLIIDSGNSHFSDTNRRLRRLEEKGYFYLGMGMSGGAAGARKGPSLMPGGSVAGYERISKILEDSAAFVNDEPCVAYLGPGSAGHYVKMVHNGIEYGLMQLIAETYDLMKRGLGMTNPELQAVYEQWNSGELSGFLMEITTEIFGRVDDQSDQSLIDMILDVARQKGTGEWTARDALALQVPAVNIDTAVMMRYLSAYKNQRQEAGLMLTGPEPRFDQDDRATFIPRLKNVLYAAFIITYAQGMALLTEASRKYKYGLQLETVARIWRGGCIIRAALLDDVRSAYQADPDLDSLLLNDHFSRILTERINDLRYVIGVAAAHGLPVPALMSSLAYFDAIRSPWLPANLIMAQRDYFGSHTYERTDRDGTFHTRWDEHKENS